MQTEHIVKILSMTSEETFLKLQKNIKPRLVPFLDSKWEEGLFCAEKLSEAALIGKPRVKRVKFQTCTIFSCEFFERFPEITELHINCADIRDSQLILIISRIGRNIRRISLSGCMYLTDLSLYTIIEKCEFLEELDISKTSISRLPILEYTCMEKFKLLRKLNLSNGINISFSNLIYLDLAQNLLDSLIISSMQFGTASELEDGIRAFGIPNKVEIVNKCYTVTKSEIEEIENKYGIEILCNTVLSDYTERSILDYLRFICNYS
eukprot:GHVP01017510.1.p1 GENE.GHVP01017510.1~~GHVP01017510.1.p1  ORF type:complete len:265 (+),score=28.45 GHVP01017510.1:264-1058(+)